MIHGSTHFRTVITVLAVTYLLHVNAATDNQKVINEINKLENMMKTLQTPPELVDAVLKQLEHHCHKNRSFDNATLSKPAECVKQQINMTKVAEDMRQAVPEGKMDNVFRDLCIKWPKVKSCMSDFFTIIDECWQKGEKVSTFVDEVVRFYCGDDNGGERIALFFAEGGLECMQTHGDEVKKCVEERQELVGMEFNEDTLNNLDDVSSFANKLNIPKNDEVCKSIEELHECASVGLRKCKDPTPENLMTSMLRQVGKALECKVKESSPQVRTSGASFGAIVNLESLIFAGMVALLAF